MAPEKGMPPDPEDVAAAFAYLVNPSQAGCRHSPPWVEAKVPIASRVTEATCLVLVKQRLDGSGRKWKEPGASAVRSLRCLTDTIQGWSEFESRIDR